MRYASNRGDADLRKAIAAYLCDFRGAHCHADQIVVVGGMQQAMLISAMALLNPGEPVWMEDPGYHQARRAFIFAGATVVPRPIDEEGIVIARPGKRKATENHSRNAFPSISPRSHDEFPAKDRAYRLCARSAMLSSWRTITTPNSALLVRPCHVCRDLIIPVESSTRER